MRNLNYGFPNPKGCRCSNCRGTSYCNCCEHCFVAWTSTSSPSGAELHSGKYEQSYRNDANDN